MFTRGKNPNPHPECHRSGSPARRLSWASQPPWARTRAAARSALLLVVLASTWSLPSRATEPLDINSASAKQLAAAMQGVGLKKAKAIIAYRDAHGPFGSIDDLSKVRGIGKSTLANNRGRLRAAGP